MILGRRFRNILKWPALRTQVARDGCTGCLRCTRGCPMGLDVHALVQKGSLEHDECILCGTCIDVCPQHVKQFSFSAGDQAAGGERADFWGKRRGNAHQGRAPA